MPLQLTIQNFRGCREAAIPLQGMVLVAGSNGAGKSSISQAAAAAVCGEWLTTGFKLLKKDAAFLVTDGAKKGFARIEEEGAGSYTVVYPSGESSQAGDIQRLGSPIAAGMNSFVAMDAADKVKYLLALTGSVPTFEDLAAALNTKNTEALNQLWKDIQTNGWDATLAKKRTDITQVKAQWRAITNEVYGSKKAEDWVPENWDESMNCYEEKDEQRLRDAVKLSKETLESAIAHNARLNAKKEGDEELAASIPSIKKELAELNDVLQSRTKTQKELDEQISKLGGWTTGGWRCPHCDGDIEIEQSIMRSPTKLIKADIGKAAERDEHNKKFGALQAERMSIQTLQSASYVAISSCEQRLKAAQSAKQRLEQSTNGEPRDIESIRLNLKKSEIRLECWRQKILADKNHKLAVNMGMVAELLEPDGERSIRQKKTVEALQKLNAQLSTLCGLAGFQPITIQSDMGVYYGNRPYLLLSLSEQYRVRCVLQVADGILDNARLLIMDAIDILDNAGRNGLLTMLAKGWKKPVLLTATILWREKCPKFPAAVGASYWLEGGTLHPVT